MTLYTFEKLNFVPNTDNNNNLLLLGTPCFQPVTIFAVFLYIGAIRSIFMMLYIVRNPFRWGGNRVNADGLLAGSDRSIFCHLRAQFTAETKKRNEATTSEVTSKSSFLQPQMVGQHRHILDEI